MENLLTTIRRCTQCKDHLPLGPRPVLIANPKAEVVIIGQAPGTKVHASGIPWDDQSGRLLRQWLQLTPEQFYHNDKIAIMPMGFCYPGKGKSGDLPPRPECAPLWHHALLENMPRVKLILLIGQYSQKYYLKARMKKNLTETVAHYEEYLPYYFPLPHPSPRNRYWTQKNPWFDERVIPALRERLFAVFKSDRLLATIITT